MRLDKMLDPADVSHGWAQCQPPEDAPNHRPHGYRTNQGPVSDALEEVMCEVVTEGYAAVRREFPYKPYGHEVPDRIVQRVNIIAQRDRIPVKARQRGQWVYIVNMRLAKTEPAFEQA